MTKNCGFQKKECCVWKREGRERGRGREKEGEGGRESGRTFLHWRACVRHNQSRHARHQQTESGERGRERGREGRKERKIERRRMRRGGREEREREGKRGRENSRCDHLTWVLVFFFFLHSTSTFTRRYVTLSRLGFLVGEGVHGGDVWRGDTRAKWRVHASAPFFALALLLLLCCAAFARGCGTSLKNLLLFELLLLLLLL